MLEPAEVEHHHVALLDHAFAHLVMRVGPVGTRADHGEIDLGVPETAQESRQVGADVDLASAGEADTEDLAVCRVGRGAGRGQPLELVVVLDGPQHREGGRHGDVDVSGSRPCSPSRCIAHAESDRA